MTSAVREALAEALARAEAAEAECDRLAAHIEREQELHAQAEGRWLAREKSLAARVAKRLDALQAQAEMLADGAQYNRERAEAAEAERDQLREIVQAASEIVWHDNGDGSGPHVSPHPDYWPQQDRLLALLEAHRAALDRTEQPARPQTLGPDPDREPHPTPRNLWEKP